MNLRPSLWNASLPLFSYADQMFDATAAVTLASLSSLPAYASNDPLWFSNLKVIQSAVTNDNKVLLCKPSLRPMSNFNIISRKYWSFSSLRHTYIVLITPPVLAWPRTSTSALGFNMFKSNFFTKLPPLYQTSTFDNDLFLRSYGCHVPTTSSWSSLDLKR